MKIPKPGKVEMRKFVCPQCGCVFVAHEDDFTLNPVTDVLRTACPMENCHFPIFWEGGEPYEEPTPTQADRERLEALLQEGTNESVLMRDLVDFLLENGVTFRKG